VIIVPNGIVSNEAVTLCESSSIPFKTSPPGALCHKLCHKVCGIGHNLYIQEGKRAAPQAVYQELTVGQKYIAEEKCLRRIEDSRKPAQETLHVTCAVRECRAIKGWDGRSDFRNIHHNRLDTFTCLDLELRFLKSVKTSRQRNYPNLDIILGLKRYAKYISPCSIRAVGLPCNIKLPHEIIRPHWHSRGIPKHRE